MNSLRHPSTQQTEEINALLQHIVAMETIPGAPLRNLEEGADVRYSIDVARRLTEPECKILAQATQLREEGLRQSRNGADIEAINSVERARTILDAGGLSPEAYLLGDSFQLAAEAFLRYRKLDYENAQQLLLTAMGSCRDLFLNYGYDVAMRRVHLGRNVVRIVRDRGRPIEALHLALGLIRYIERDAEAWPWPELSVADERRLTLDMRHALMDQVLSEIARITAATEPALLLILDSSEGKDLLTAKAPISEFARAHSWLHARHHAARSDWSSYIDSALCFFSEPPGRYGAAWRALVKDAQVGAQGLPGSYPP